MPVFTLLHASTNPSRFTAKEDESQWRRIYAEARERLDIKSSVAVADAALGLTPIENKE